MTTAEIINNMKTHISNAYDSVESKGGKQASNNLFDKDDANLIRGGYLGINGVPNFSVSEDKTLILSIKPNISYTISKISSSRFRIATFKTKPYTNMVPTNYLIKENDTYATITSGIDDNYLVVFYYSKNNDKSVSEEEIRNSIMINEGTEALPYEPYNKPKNLQNLSSAIDSIPSGGGDKWQPNPDWWDIDKILEDDTEDYAGKMIYLLNDGVSTTYFNTSGATKIKFSDGSEWNNGESTQHTWNTDYDKECSLGYKTRYMIFYYPDGTTTKGGYPTYGNYFQIMYAIVKNMTIKNGVIFANQSNLQGIKFINSFLDNDTIWDGLSSLKSIENIKTNSNSKKFAGAGWYCATQDVFNSIDYSNNTSLQSSFRSNYVIKNFKMPSTVNLEKITNYQECFRNSNFITIDKIDFTSCLNVTHMFTNCRLLTGINEILGELKVSDLTLNSCYNLNHDTLIKFLNALYDYSTSEDTYSLTLGSTNLAKITDEEKAIATNKGWTLA